MPIYEFYCPDCHRVFSFLSRTVDTRKQPACPKCSRPGLSRRPSSFAISRGRPEPSAGTEAEAGAEPDPFAGVDEARLERAMEQLAGEAETLNEDDPRAQARLMRRLFDTAGVPVQGGMQEALRRLEAGEDPEVVEAEMGDVLDGAGGEPLRAPEARRALTGMRQRLPPSVDRTLYEL